jgi:hypothetical protein
VSVSILVRGAIEPVNRSEEEVGVDLPECGPRDASEGLSGIAKGADYCKTLACAAAARSIAAFLLWDHVDLAA